MSEGVVSINPKDAANMAVFFLRSNGLDVRDASHSLDHSTIQYGYAYLRFDRTGVSARREGGDLPLGSFGERRSYDLKAQGTWMLEVMRTGRTVECGKGIGLRSISDPVHYQAVDYPFHYLAGIVRDGDDPWDLDPDYQRDHVWTLEQREAFLGYMLENGRMPLVWLNMGRWPFEDTRIQVLDGKQRITSILRFIDGEIGAELSDGRRVFWADFDEVDRRTAPLIKCAQVNLHTKADVLRFYLKLNRGGTVHTDAEINRVRALLDAERASFPWKAVESEGARALWTVVGIPPVREGEDPVLGVSVGWPDDDKPRNSPDGARWKAPRTWHVWAWGTLVEADGSNPDGFPIGDARSLDEAKGIAESHIHGQRERLARIAEGA